MLDFTPTFCSLDEIVDLPDEAADPFHRIAEVEAEFGCPIVALRSCDDTLPRKLRREFVDRKPQPVVKPSLINQEPSMNLHDVLVNKSYGESAYRLTLIAASNLCQFHLRNSVYASFKKPEEPLVDKSRLAALGVLPSQIEGTERDTGRETQREIDTLQIARVFAGVFRWLGYAAYTPDPETGKVPVSLQALVCDIDGLVKSMVDWQTRNGKETQQAKAEALKLKRDPSARIAHIEKANAEKFANALLDVRREFDEAVKLFVAEGPEAFAEALEEALADLGENPQKWVHDVMVRHIERQAERFDAGLYTNVDSGVYALANINL